MAIPTVTNSVHGDSAASNTTDITLTVSGNSSRVLIGFAMAWDSDPFDFTSVTFDPGGGDEASFTQEVGSVVDYAAPDTSDHECSIWYLILSDSVSSGSYTIRFTNNTAATRASCAAWEVAGANTTDPIGASGTGSGLTAVLSADVTTTATNSLVIMGGEMREEVTFAAGADDNEVTDYQNQILISGWTGYTNASTIGTYTISATSSDSPAVDSWAATAVEILEGATGPDPVSVNISPESNYVVIV